MTTGQPAPHAPGNRPSQRVLVIIPTYNELENLPVIHRRLKDACPHVHLLIVDDSSPDGTGQLAEELAAADAGRTHVMHRTAKDGLGAAYLAGFAWGLSRDYSVLVEMDADGSHAPNSCTACWTRSTAAPIWPSARATSTAGRCATGPGGGGRCPGPPTPTRGWRWASGCTTSPPATAPTGARSSGDRPRRRRLQGLLLPDRPDVADHLQRVHHRRGAHHVHRTRARRVQDERIQHPRSPGQSDPMGHSGPPVGRAGHQGGQPQLNRAVSPVDGS